MESWINIIGGILGIIGVIYSVTKYLIPHHNIEVEVTADRKSELQTEKTTSEDYVNQAINDWFGETKEPLYHYKYLFEIMIKPESKIKLQFLSAYKPDKTLTLLSGREIHIKGKRQGSFTVFYPEQSRGYHYPFLEKDDFKILMIYKTWKILPHYLHYVA
jgi:hypothetical protein